MKKRIVLLRNSKKIFVFQNNAPKHVFWGETDIYLNAGKGLFFEHVVAGDYFRCFSSPEYRIDSASWHGYFEKINEKLIYTPIVHFKNKTDNGIEKLKLWHFGCINQEEPMAVPVCSVYIPRDLDIQHKGNVKKSNRNEYIELNSYDCNVRVDFFVLPKNMTFQQIEKSPAILFYKFADIDFFNRAEVFFKSLSVNRVENKIISKVGGNDIFVRLVVDPDDMFNEINKSFSLIVIDPNDLYNKIFNRDLVEYHGDGKFSKPRILKKAHEQGLGVKQETGSTFWKYLCHILKQN